MRKTTKWLATILLLALICTLFPITSFASEDLTGTYVSRVDGSIYEFHIDGTLKYKDEDGQFFVSENELTVILNGIVTKYTFEFLGDILVLYDPSGTGVAYDRQGTENSSVIPQATTEDTEATETPLNILKPFMFGKIELPFVEYVSDRTDTLGNIYTSALRGFMGVSPDYECSCTYDIGGQFTLFTAIVAVAETENASDSCGIIRIYGDERLLWSDENIKRSTKPYKIQLDIRGVTDLKIEMYGSSSSGWSSNFSVLLGDPTLSDTRSLPPRSQLNNQHFAEEEKGTVIPVFLYRLQPYTYGRFQLSFVTYESDRKDTMGNLYSSALAGFMPISEGENSCTYDIGRNYSLLTATVAVIETESSGNASPGIIRIYGDNRLLWSDENITIATRPYEIRVDVTGVTDLRIEMYGADSDSFGGGFSVLLGNPVLS